MSADFTAAPAALALAPYAALLGLVYVYLALRVIKARYRVKAALGTAGDAGLERAVRVHGNFAEYVPFALLLILLVGLTGWGVWAVRGLGALLLAARLLHAYGVSQEAENYAYRKFGMIATFTVFGVCAVLLLIKGIF
jgi:uncharacterized protein